MADHLICIWCNQPFESQDVDMRAALCCTACEQVFLGAEGETLREVTVALRAPDDPDEQGAD
ncbi:MAG TPA: hypothetical protein VJ748_03535 [Vitreimonas sp.]|jgi:hypothetical protein|nr:hypothetical protein [Vitreimonas sp.]